VKYIEKRTRDVWHLEWGGRVQEGLIFRSLCGECNSWCGAKYGTHYAEFIGKVAEKIERASEGERILITGIRRPLSILKQVVQLFVSANGREFVEKNNWIRKLLKSSRNRDWPPGVYLYLFATNCRVGRKSGVAGVLHFARRSVRVLSEFTFWPLGAVLSYSEINDRGLSPIHQWTAHEYTSQVRTDLWLTVNPVETPYPLDFRSASRIRREAFPGDEALLCRDEDLAHVLNTTLEKAGESRKESFAIVARRPVKVLP
jgi:hypothetical protein